jgi:hypothetical protein
MRKSALLILWLALVTVPCISPAAVVVAEPTGDADAAFLTDLKASLEIVAAEAPAELNAGLRAMANVKEEGVEIVVELVLADGSDTIRETRVATLASALPQARAMGRVAFRELAAPPPKVVVVKERPAGPPPLVEKYDRRRLLRMSVWPTLLGSLLGPAVFSLGFLALDRVEGLFTTCIVAGSIVTTTALVSGPSIGYFGLGRPLHALAMSGLRLALLGTGTLGTIMYVMIGGGDCIEEEEGEWRCPEPSPAWLILGVTSVVAAYVTAFVDAALVGRAADRANEQFRRSLHVTVAPVAWTDGNGQRTFGLALNGSF